MSEMWSAPSRRSVLVTAAALGAVGAFPAAVRAAAADTIRPFHIDVSEAEAADLRRRVVDLNRLDRSGCYVLHARHGDRQ